MPFIKPKFKKAKKKCAYAGCKKHFMGVSSGVNPAKYCETHRNPKNRVIVTKERRKEVVGASSNQIIKHSYKLATVIQGKCQVEGCGRDFEILIIPNTYTYAKFCPEHRNEYKRERFLLNGKVN